MEFTLSELLEMSLNDRLSIIEQSICSSGRPLEMVTIEPPAAITHKKNKPFNVNINIHEKLLH